MSTAFAHSVPRDADERRVDVVCILHANGLQQRIRLSARPSPDDHEKLSPLLLHLRGQRLAWCNPLSVNTPTPA
jgi:hypothetical protein